MRSIFHLIAAALVLVASPAFAQSGPLTGIGVVLMHGKGGQPGGNIGGLASTLESQGALVVMPTMAWAGSRGVPASYDLTYEQALGDIDSAVATLRARGARKIVVAGQSLGANAAIAYAARKGGQVAGVMALAPGHTPERMRRPPLLKAVADARAQVAAGQGGARGQFPDSNQGQVFSVSGTAAGWSSYYDANGSANMAKNAARLTQPFLYVIGTSDPLIAEGRGYIFSRAKANPKSRYVEVDAGHFNTPDKARDEVVAWLKAL